MDYNVDNYTISELLGILELNNPDQSQTISMTNKYIRKFTEEGNTQLVRFFNDMQRKLLEYLQELQEERDAEYDADPEQTDAWIKYES